MNSRRRKQTSGVIFFRIEIPEPKNRETWRETALKTIKVGSVAKCAWCDVSS